MLVCICVKGFRNVSKQACAHRVRMCVCVCVCVYVFVYVLCRCQQFVFVVAFAVTSAAYEFYENNDVYKNI